MATPLSVGTHRRDDGTVVLRASGELDMSNIAVFASALTDGLGALSPGSGVLM